MEGTWWRGQLFLFDKLHAAQLSPQSRSRSLAIFIFLEVLARPLLFAADARWVSAANRDWVSAAQLTILTVLGLWLTLKVAGIPLSQIGLRPWSRWSETEKYYLIEVVPIAIAIFTVAVFPDLKAVWSHPGVWLFALLIVAQKLVWGFYQELFYRALLQAELVRRWGVSVGILVSNVIFTFGPLHTYHFVAAWRSAPALWIFGGIFAIGLFFAVLYQRSGNLWIVGFLHGLGDWFIDGLSQVARLAV